MTSIKTFSKILTVLTSATFFPAYVSTIFSFFPPVSTVLNPLLSSFLGILFLSLIPMILVAYSAKKKHHSVLVAGKKERNFLYLASIISYIISASLFWYLGSHIMFLISIAYIAVASSVAIVNLFWKVSAHTTGTAGPITALVYVYGMILLPMYLIVLPVAYLRYKDKAHTTAQLVAGAFIAIIVTFLIFAIFY